MTGPASISARFTSVAVFIRMHVCLYVGVNEEWGGREKGEGIMEGGESKWS